jgi:hypothetical protein
VREALHLRTGDCLDFLIEPNGMVRIVPVTSSVVELKGMLPPPERALTLEQMDEAIAQGAARSDWHSLVR